MSTSQTTVLKLRHLKQCDATSKVVSRLPRGCAADMLQFNVSIPTKLWKVLVGRQAMAVSDGPRGYGSVVLLPVRDIRDLSVSTGVLSRLSISIPAGLCVPDAVLVNPVSEEEFRSYGLKISYITVSFVGTDNFNLGIVLEGLTGSGAGRAIFDARRFADLLSERPTGALVSYVINI